MFETIKNLQLGQLTSEARENVAGGTATAVKTARRYMGDAKEVATETIQKFGTGWLPVGVDVTRGDQALTVKVRLAEKAADSSVAEAADEAA